MQVSHALGLLVAVLVVMSPVAHATGVIDIDQNHGLNSDDAKQSYETNGVAHAEVVAPNLALTIATDADDVTGDIPHTSDVTQSYLEIEYKSDKPITVRLYLNSSVYVGGYVSQDTELAYGSGTANIGIAEDGRYTTVTVTFHESGTKVVPLSTAKAKHYGIVDGIGAKWGGLDVAEDDGSWQYAPESALSGNNTTYAIKTASPEELVVEYRKNTSDGVEWRAVPSKTTHTAPVYEMRKNGVNDTVYIISETSDAPQIRYKMHRGPLDFIGGIGDGFATVVEQMQSDVQGILSALSG